MSRRICLAGIVAAAIALPANAAWSEEIYLTISAEELSSTKVRLEFGSNIPLPVEVMVGVDLADQKPDDIWIGASTRIWLRESKTVYVLDTSKKKLPSGKYDAEVAFYNRWGASNGNPAASTVPDIVATSPIVLKGTGASASDRKRRDELQRWVMETIYMGYPWNPERIENRLGESELLQAELNLHTAYYFGDAGMTLLVNELKGTITVWRMGRATK